VLVLLDESLPRQLSLELREFDCHTVGQQKWTGLANGELLRKAKSEGFDVFITADQNLEYQQNLSRSGLAVIIVAARSNRMIDLRPLVPQIKGTIRKIKSGQVLRISS